MRKGKSTSVDLGEGAKEEDEGAKEGGEGAEAGGAEGEASATPPEETNASHGAAEEEKTEAVEVEKTPSKAAVTNGENSCSNGTAEVEHTTNHHQEEEKSAGSPVKKVKEAGAKDDANAKIINATAAVNSGELELDAGGSNHEDANDRHMLTNLSCRPACQQPELAYAVSRGEADEAGRAESCDQSERAGEEEEEEEQMKRRELRDAAVAIVQNVMSAAADQLERELCTDNGLNGCYHGDM